MKNLIEKLESLNVPADAAEFLDEWYPECEGIIDSIISEGGNSYIGCRVYSEEEWQDVLDWFEVSEEEYEERHGHVFRDAAFEGVLVIGE